MVGVNGKPGAGTVRQERKRHLSVSLARIRSSFDRLRTNGCYSRLRTSGCDRRPGTDGCDRRPGTDGSDRRLGTSGCDRRLGTSGCDRRLGTNGSDRRLGTNGSDRRLGTDGCDSRLRRPLRNAVIPVKAGIQGAFSTKKSKEPSRFTPIPTFPIEGEGVLQRSLRTNGCNSRLGANGCNSRHRTNGCDSRLRGVGCASCARCFFCTLGRLISIGLCVFPANAAVPGYRAPSHHVRF